jgi:DNA-binding CsgD family transcriptional regulator
MSDRDEQFETLLEQSSLGTPGARQLRRRTPPEQVEAVRNNVELRRQMALRGDDVYRRVRAPEPLFPDPPATTIARLPKYLRALHAVAESGAATISNGELAAASKVNLAKLYKDLSYLMIAGTPEADHDVAMLIWEIKIVLHLDPKHWPTTAERGRRQRDDASRLTKAERAVAVLAATGLTNAQIAAQLGRSKRTVDNHLRRIFAKLDISRRSELSLAFAREHPAERDA